MHPAARLATIENWAIQPFVHNKRGPKIGGSVPFWGRRLGPHLTQSPGPRLSAVRPFFGRGSGVPPYKVAWAEGGLTPYQLSGILIHAAIWLQQIWAENWGLCPFGEGEAG